MPPQPIKILIKYFLHPTFCTTVTPLEARLAYAEDGGRGSVTDSVNTRDTPTRLLVGVCNQTYIVCD